MSEGDPRRVNVVCIDDDGKEITVASAFLAGENVLITGSDEAIETIRSDVCERCGLSQHDGAEFLDGMLDTYQPSVAVAYGAWCATIPKTRPTRP